MATTRNMRRSETTRQWIYGLAISVTAIVCLFAFWRLAPGATLIVAVASLVVLVTILWLAGRPTGDD